MAVDRDHGNISLGVVGVGRMAATQLGHLQVRYCPDMGFTFPMPR